MGKSKMAVYNIGKLVFIPTHLKIYDEIGKPVANISCKLADILIYLINNKDNVSRRRDILIELWGEESFFIGRSLSTYICKLRKILKIDTSLSIETISCVGFILHTTQVKTKISKDKILELLQDESRERHEIRKKSLETPDWLLEKQAKFKKIAQSF